MNPTAPSKSNFGSISNVDLPTIRRHVQYAYDNVPFYKKLYGDALTPFNPSFDFEEFRRLPFVTKEMIIADQIDSPPFGSFDIELETLTRVSLIASQYFMLLTQHDFAELTELYVESYRTLGVTPSDIVDLSSAFHWVQGGTQCDAALRELGAAVIPGGPGQSRQRIRIMSELGVTVLHAFTPYAEELAARFTEYGINAAEDLNVRLLLIGGELRDAFGKERLEAAWGGAVAREFYGVSEVGMLATECFEVGDGMHVSSRCLVEVIDPDTEQRVDFGIPGEIVVTELFRHAQPFIRYRTGDLTEGLIEGACECGRNSTRIGRIIGRNSDVRRVKGLFVLPSLLGEAVKRVVENGIWTAVVERKGSMDQMSCLVESTLSPEEFAPVQERLSLEIKDSIGITCVILRAPVGTIGNKFGTIEDTREAR